MSGHNVEDHEDYDVDDDDDDEDDDNDVDDNDDVGMRRETQAALLSLAVRTATVEPLLDRTMTSSVLSLLLSQLVPE